MSDRSLLEELLDIERGFWDAAGDIAYYRSHFHDEGLMLLPHLPHPMDKAAVLASIDGAAPWARHAMDDVAFVSPDPSVAVLAYRVEAERTGEPVYRALIASVYTARAGRWQLLSHQHTPLHAAPESR